MYQKKTISMIIFIHLRNENHPMNSIQHVKKNVLYYHFRTTSKLHDFTTPLLHNFTTPPFHKNTPANARAFLFFRRNGFARYNG